MPEYTAKVIDNNIEVSRDKDNKFSLEITASSGELKDVIVRIEIPCGPEKNSASTFLLATKDAHTRVNYQLSDKSTPLPKLIDAAKPAPPANYVAWETPSAGITIATKAMKIEVTEFGGNIPSGTAKVIVGIRNRGPAEKNEFTEKTLDVPVSLNPKDSIGLKIHYFVASKDYVLHAGEEEVVLSFFITGAKEVTLFKNNTKIWPPPGGSQDLFFKDKPSITSVYRLEANDSDDREKLLKDRNLVVGYLTVQVAQAGWNRQPLHQGYPTVLMKALSFTSGEAERLYGVFVDPATKAAGLYSSATGFPPWQKEPLDDPKDFKEIVSGDHSLIEMSHSPGVASGGKLWLIGGSSVDPTKYSNEVWHYQKNNTTNKGEWVRDTPALFPPRMGHCVVEFKGKIWVLGGSNGTSPLSDVWSYDYNGKDETKKWHQETTNANWPARCMFAAVATSAAGTFPPFDKEKMWIYGGTKDPDTIKPMTNLWSSEDGVNWQQEETLELGPLSGQPNGATLLWDDDRLHLAGSFKAGTRKDSDNNNGATLSAMVYSLCAQRYLWEANPVSWGWEQFGGNTFLMRSLVFNRFWFFWSFRQDIKTAPKLNVFIPA